MNEEKKQIHLYMHSKNELGLATLCVEKDKEIERLKEMKLHTEKYASEMEDKYILEKSKNDKAIEYIENNDLYYQDVDYDYEENMILGSPSDEQAKKDLIGILKGVDKE